MSAETLIWLALAIPFIGALPIALTGWNPNLREGITLVTAGLLFFVVASLLPEVMNGARPEVTLAEPLPGLPLTLKVEPLGMTFAAVASFLWIVNSIYSIGYMRGHNETNQTRFYVCFAVALASTMGVAFAGNMLELRNRDGEPVWAMSQQAWDSLDKSQQARLEAHGRIVTAAIDNIESAAGGSVRCMLAEIHLPRVTA